MKAFRSQVVSMFGPLQPEQVKPEMTSGKVRRKYMNSVIISAFQVAPLTSDYADYKVTFRILKGKSKFHIKDFRVDQCQYSIEKDGRPDRIPTRRA